MVFWHKRKLEIINKKISPNLAKRTDFFVHQALILVEVTGLEPAASCSQSTRATNCATPRYLVSIQRIISCAARYRFGAAEMLAHTPRYIKNIIPIYYTTKSLFCLHLFVKYSKISFVIFRAWAFFRGLCNSYLLSSLFHKIPLTFSLIYVIL